ncbi:MAG: PstS family phosphate ABC transporter substrate-binding protein [Bacteroidia bacterium]|nr:PstS family phosphate ABC transporter substrate-binding protein [Bacteroidia bacterium]
MLRWLAALFALGSCVRRPLIVVKGSDTVLPLSQMFAESYLEQSQAPLISVTGGGSGIGIAALMNGDADIAMSSRPLKLAEQLRLTQKGIRPVEDTIAWDVLAICVHPSNPVQRLTRQQIADIYAGKIRNWKEIGGDDVPILPYSRESSSGTFEFFRDHILQGKDFAQHVRFIPATGMLVQAIAQTPGSIGYVGIAYVNSSIKVVAVGHEGDTNYYYPARSQAEMTHYPIARPLYYYYDLRKQVDLAPFLRFVHSERGRKIVEEVGYVP